MNRPPMLIRQRVVNVAHAIRDLLASAGYAVELRAADDGAGAVVFYVIFTDEVPVRVRIGEPQ